MMLESTDVCNVPNVCWQIDSDWWTSHWKRPFSKLGVGRPETNVSFTSLYYEMFIACQHSRLMPTAKHNTRLSDCLSIMHAGTVSKQDQLLWHDFLNSIAHEFQFSQTKYGTYIFGGSMSFWALTETSAEKMRFCINMRIYLVNCMRWNAYQSLTENHNNPTRW